jgi:ABC-type cobalt transport system substrate-binding protein
MDLWVLYLLVVIETPTQWLVLKHYEKKAQKMAMKNKASETINKITPKFNPFCTAAVWSPKKVPSAIISRNQKDIDEISSIKAKYNE